MTSTASLHAPYDVATGERRVDWIEFQSRRVPHKDAIVEIDTGRHVTYAQLHEGVLRRAAHLHHSGVKVGDRVAVLSGSCADVFELLYACARVGAVLVPLNWRLAPTELRGIVDDCEPTLLYHDDDNEAVARTLGEGTDHRTFRWDDPVDGSEDTSSSSSVPQRESAAGEAWIIVYTSGTTGKPKGAVHTIESVRANIDNSAFACEVNSNSVVLNALPTFHVAGLHLYANPALMFGGTVLLMNKFDAVETLALLADSSRAITHFGGVPAMFQRMAAELSFASSSVSGIRATVGGSPVPPTLIKTWQDKGMAMMPIYGATEAGSSLLFAPAIATAPDSGVGIATLHAETTIRDATGEQVGVDTVGELWVRGPMVMSGYWRKPDETSKAINRDGWFRTGDAASLDSDGNHRIVDRWKDMFISGGENVYPAEIENVLYQHPEVVLASVIGVASARWGEAGVAYVVRGDDATVDSDGLLEWCRDRLASYKVPIEIVFRNDLPRNATGKIVKSQLKSSHP